MVTKRVSLVRMFHADFIMKEHNIRSKDLNLKPPSTSVLVVVCYDFHHSLDLPY